MGEALARLLLTIPRIISGHVFCKSTNIQHGETHIIQHHLYMSHAY